MYQTSPVNPALASLLQVASMETPEGTPTVAAQLAGAAGAPVMPQGVPQGMPQQPGMQGIMRQAQTGAQIQQQQQQEQQQALQQLLAQQQAQQQAMRFGVAAAPGARSIRMAEGGIVGYAGGAYMNPDIAKVLQVDPEFDEDGNPRSRDEREAILRRQEQARAIQQNAQAQRQLLEARQRQTAAMPSSERLETIEQFYRPRRNPQLESVRQEFAQPPVRPATSAAAGPGVLAAQPVEPPRERPPVAEQGILAGQPSAGDFARADRVPIPPAPGITGFQKPLQEARDLASGIETVRAKPEDVVKAQQERDVAYDAYMRSRGADPRFFLNEVEESKKRVAAQTADLDRLAAQREASRGGLDGLIRMLTAAGGRTDPLVAIGQNYGRVAAERLADNERFMIARNNLMNAEAGIQRALLEKNRAEARGDITGRETALNAEMDLRNKKREAQGNVALEAAKLFQKSESDTLQRQTQLEAERIRAAAQQDRAGNKAEGQEELRRLKVLAELSKDDAYQRAKNDEYRLGLKAKRTPEEQQRLDYAKTYMKQAYDDMYQKVFGAAPPSSNAAGAGAPRMPNVMTKADVSATVAALKAQGKNVTEQQVIDAAKQRGITIQ